MNPLQEGSTEGRNVRPRVIIPTDLDEEWDREVFPVQNVILGRFMARRTPPINPDEGEAFRVRDHQRRVDQLRQDFIRHGMPTSPVTEADPDEVINLNLDINEDPLSLSANDQLQGQQHQRARAPLARLDDIAELDVIIDGQRYIDLSSTWRDLMSN